KDGATVNWLWGVGPIRRSQARIIGKVGSPERLEIRLDLLEYPPEPSVLGLPKNSRLSAVGKDRGAVRSPERNSFASYEAEHATRELLTYGRHREALSEGSCQPRELRRALFPTRVLHGSLCASQERCGRDGELLRSSDLVHGVIAKRRLQT